MQLQSLHVLSALTALAICCVERREFRSVLEEIRRSKSDRTLLDRVLWGAKRPSRGKTQPQPPVQSRALVDRLMHEAEHRANQHDQRRRIASTAISRVAAATQNSKDDLSLL